MIRKNLLIVLMAIFLCFSSALATTYYVAPNGDDADNGTSWSTAFETLSEALATATSGDDIWVAAGTYKPGTSRSSTFQMVTGVDVYGGFDGSETVFSQRDWRANETILSGDIGTIDTYADNCYHVVTGGVSSASLDGFTITKGYANAAGAPDNYGGGLFSNLDTYNCIFEDNYASGNGGAAWMYTSCEISNCIFRNNSSDATGGAIYLYEAYVMFKNDLFYDNSADEAGAIYVYDASPLLTNCTFTKNDAINGNGGALYFTVCSNSAFKNCILQGNTATGSGDQIFKNLYSGNPSYSYCNIENSFDANEVWNTSLGTNSGYNIDEDPCFVDANNDDFHIALNSPCVDYASYHYDYDYSSKLDVYGEDRLSGAFLDIGADEYALDSNDTNNPMMLLGERTEWNLTHTLEDPAKRKYFAPDFVWATKLLLNGDESDFDILTNELRRVNPNTTLGCYISSSAVKNNEPNYYVPISFPFEDISDEWILRTDSNDYVTYGYSDPNRFVLDIRDSNIRKAVIDKAIENTLEFNLDAVCFDNCYWGQTPYGRNPSPNDWPTDINSQDWTDAFMEFFEDANEAVDANGLKLVVNVAIVVDEIPDAFEAIEPYVDGIMTELPFHQNIRTDSYLDDELDAYESVLEKGKMVLLFTGGREMEDPNIMYQEEKFALCKIRALAEKYSSFIGAVAPTMIHDEPLYAYGTNLIANADFNDWTGGNPNDWTVTGESGSDPSITQVGYVNKIAYWNQDYECLMQDHEGLDTAQNTNYGTGACNLYTTGTNDISISQDISTVVGKTYRVSLYIGQTEDDDPNLIGALTLSGDSGVTFEESFSTYGIKTFTFKATSSTTTFQIENSDSNETDITFDDIAIWRINENF